MKNSMRKVYMERFINGKIVDRKRKKTMNSEIPGLIELIIFDGIY